MVRAKRARTVGIERHSNDFKRAKTRAHQVIRADAPNKPGLPPCRRLWGRKRKRKRLLPTRRLRSPLNSDVSQNERR